MSDLNTSVTVNLAGNLDRRAKQYSRSLDKFSRNGRRDLGRLNRSVHSLGRGMENLAGRYTAAIGGIGAAYISTRALMNSADLTQQLTLTQLTAQATDAQVKNLRASLHDMAEETGNSTQVLLGGFQSLIESGMSWDQALATIKAINPAMAVTGAKADTLGKGLAVVSKAFHFDLSKPGMAVKLLDQMTVAGRKGNAELQDISNIMGRIGVNAAAAGMSFETTLGFVEGLSQLEMNPERLATLADSTLRLFNNGRYMKAAHEKGGIDFYDDSGNRKKAFDVFEQIAKKMKTKNTDQAQNAFLQNVFGKTDQDTIKGLRMLLSKGMLQKMRETTQAAKEGSGAIAKGLEKAMDNANKQAARLKNKLSSAADSFAVPLLDAFTKASKWAMDDAQLSGKEMLAYGAGAAVLGFGALKLGGRALQGVGGLSSGLAVGSALEETAGVQSVYVVNMPSATSYVGGRGGSEKISRRDAAGRWIKRGGVALIAGYAVGTAINAMIDKFLPEFGDAIGETVAKILAWFGLDEAVTATGGHNPGGGLGKTAATIAAIGGSDEALHALVADRVRQMAAAQQAKVKLEVEAKPGTKVNTKEVTGAVDLETVTQAGVRHGGGH